MDQPAFITDLFDTFQSLTPWVQALALLVPPGFVALMTALVLRHRRWGHPASERLTVDLADAFELAYGGLDEGDSLLVQRKPGGALMVERLPSPDRPPSPDRLQIR